MARGQVITIANQAGKLITTENHNEAQSAAILNPNDGVIYLKLNGPAGSTSSSWDWKLPSQSYGIFPGPWQSLGLYYTDLSGAGLPADINVYDNNERLIIPDIRSIGRALQQAGTALDITEGTLPANPGGGRLRIWADVNDILHGLNSAGIDESYISTRTGLGGVLTGSLPNPGLAGGVAAANIVPPLILAAPASGGFYELILRSGGNAGGDLPGLQLQSLAGTTEAEFWCDSAGGSTRIKALGALALHAGNVGFSGTNQFMIITPAGVIDFTGASSVLANLPRVSGYIGGPITMTTINTFYDGPQIAVPTGVGQWFVVGTITVNDPTASAIFHAKLYDGTNQYAATAGQTVAAGGQLSLTLASIVTTPVGAIRIAVENVTRNGGTIMQNTNALANASQIYGIRIT